jgi:KDO2-lipid IV(A) lauroyltransferase
MRAAIIRLIIRGSALLPLPLVHALGAALGWLASIIPNEQRAAAWDNLRLCFPQMSEADRRRLHRRSLMETGKGALETGPLWLWPMGRIERAIKAVHGLDILRAGIERDRGVILIAPHLGAWEVAGVYFPRHAPLTSMYRPLREPALERLVREGRERSGARLVTADAGGVKQLFQALRRGQAVGILPDQRPKEATAGVMADFYGIPASTGILIPRLLQKSGATPIFVFSLRLPRGRGFEVHCLAAPEGIDDPDPAVATRALNAGVEACIALRPEQYLWSYRRFPRAVYRKLHARR